MNVPDQSSLEILAVRVGAVLFDNCLTLAAAE
jgi:hypothetical protein